MREPQRYAIGQQDFKTLRESNAIYIDKTPFIERLVDSNTQYYFLARPRRFGKSLLLSTISYFFEGKRELFEGLHIHDMDWDWGEYPVFHLDLNTERYASPEKLESVLSFLFSGWEALPFRNDHRKLFKIGVNFSSRTRRISDWIIDQG